MSFQWPLALLALLLVPLAIAGYVVLERRRDRDATRFGSAALLPNIVPRSPGRLRHIPVALALLALTILLVGVARPHATRSVPREEATVVLAIDVSFSMVAKDVRPTRLAAAQAAARAFLDKVPKRYRVAVVAFGTKAAAVAQPTQDRDVVQAALGNLRPGEGTALGEAIVLSLRLGGRNPRAAPPMAILVLSDGAQTQGRVTPAQAAARARARRVPVYTVALGTQDGVVERPLANGYKERIRVPPDPATLRRLAATTGGEFFAAPDEERLKKVYEDLGSRLGRKAQRQEITTAFGGAGLVLLLGAGTLSSLWFRRLP